MKHIYNFSNMGGRKCQVVTSTELSPELLAKYKKVLGIACTHTEEPLGNDIARPFVMVPKDHVATAAKVAESFRPELDQMTARCARLLWAAEHFDEVDECEKIMAEAAAALREGKS